MKPAFILLIACVVAVFAATGLAQQISNVENAPATPQISHRNDSSASRSSQAAPPTSEKHKIGRFDISINWRTRTEGWEWFQGNPGNSEYPFFDSLLRVGIGQTRDRFDWFIEGEQASILGLPNDAVVPPPQGQLEIGRAHV